MTTLPGLASKGEKGKSKYQSLDINSLYRVSRGESLEPHAAKSALPRKHGMQSLGKVPSARRPPANLPSLKAETSGGSDSTAVSLVPTTGGTLGSTTQGATWGKSPVESSSINSAPTTTTPQNTSISPVKTTTVPGGLTPHQAAIAIPVTNTILPQPKQQQQQQQPIQPIQQQHQQQLQHPNTGIPSGNQIQSPPSGGTTPSVENRPVTYSTQSHDNKSWSAVMTGSDIPGGGQPPPYQSAQFQHEFPSLSGNADTAENVAPVTVQRSGADTQYGPGPSLRPQTEGSWMQGGCGGPGGAPEVGSSVQPGSVPVGHPMLQQPLPQFRGVIPPFMYKGNFPTNAGPAGGPMNQLNQSPAGNFHAGVNSSGGVGMPPLHGGATPPITTGGPRGQTTNNRYRSGPQPSGPPPSILDDLAQRPIIKEEDLNRMDDMTRDAGWAANDDIDYNQKLAFSDDETVPESESRKESVRQSSLPPKESEKPHDPHVDNKLQTSSRGWSSSRNIPQPQDQRNPPQSSGGGQSSSRSGSRSNEDDELWIQRRKQPSEEVALAVERAKKRKEEEEKRFRLEQREAANKKLEELDRRIKEKQTIDGKTFEESQGTINPAVVPPQIITPVPIPVPDWEKDRETRERERDRDRDRECDRDRERDSDRERENVRDRETENVRSGVSHGLSEFRQLTQIEGRNLHRNEQRNTSDRGSDRDSQRSDVNINRADRERDRDRDMREQRENREAPNFSRQFQVNLPPRFQRAFQQQERQRAPGGTASPQLPPVSKPPSQQQQQQQQQQQSNSNSNVPFVQQYDPRWIQSQNSRRYRNDSDIDDDQHRDSRRDRYTPDDNRYRQHNMPPAHRSYVESGSRKSNSSSDSRDVQYKDNRDSRERDVRDNRYYDDYNRNNYRNSQEYDYDKRDNRDDSDRKERDRDRQQFDDMNRDHERDRDHREISRQDSNEYRDDNNRREFVDRNSRSEDIRDIDRHRNSEDNRRSHQYDRDDRMRDMDRLQSRDDRYRDERPQRPDSRDSRASKESRHSRDSMRDLEYTGSWADERAPFEEEKRKDSYREDRGDRRVPGPITREKMEADELRSEKRNLTQLKRSTSGQSLDKKPEMKKIDEKVNDRKTPADDDDWVVPKKETTPIRSSIENINSPKAWADAISPSTIAVENVENEKLNNDKNIEIKEEITDNSNKIDKDTHDSIKDKDDKRNNRNTSHNRGGGGGRDHRNNRWSGSGGYNVYRGWSGSGSSSGRDGGGSRRGQQVRMGSHRPSSSRSSDWKQTDSELSGDEISASNESSKDDRRSHRSPIRKVDKDDKNLEVKQEKPNVTSDRRFEKRNYETSRPSSGSSREGYIPRGEPSRRGRGNFRSTRGGTGSKRMDGYGPPTTKSPFSQQSQSQFESEKKVNSGDETGDEILTPEEKIKLEQLKLAAGIIEKKVNSGDETGDEILTPEEKIKLEQLKLAAGIIEKKVNSGDETGDEILTPEQKIKLEQLNLVRGIIRSRMQSRNTNVPPRMQRKSDTESTSSRHRKQRSNKNSDKYGEITSDNNSDTESERKDARNGRKISVGSKSGSNSSTQQTQGSQTQRQNSNNSTVSNNSNRSRSGSQTITSTSRAPGAEKRSNNTYQGRSSNQSNRQNSGSNLRSSQSVSKSKDGGGTTVNRVDEIQLNDPNTLTNALSDLKVTSKDPKKEDDRQDMNNEDVGEDGFQEVRSKKNVKPQKDENIKQMTAKKDIKDTNRTNSVTKSTTVTINKSNGPITSTSTANIPPLLGTPVNPPNKNQFDRPRQKNVPPRFIRQRESRIHKAQQMQQSGGGNVMCDVNEMNKINQSVSLYSVKEPINQQMNAWDKNTQDSLSIAIDKCGGVDLEHQSGTSSQRSSPNTDSKGLKLQDKFVLDGSTPPVNTIIFENTNYKSPGDLKTKFNNHVKNSTQQQQRGGGSNSGGGGGMDNKNRTINKLDDNDIDNQTMLAFNKPINEMIDKKPESIQLPLSFNKASEDSADMKLDFNFDSDLTQLTDDKKGLGGLPRSIHAMTSNTTISPSTAELNLKIASVKKVWEKSMPPVLEHNVTTEEGTINTTANFATLDPASAFSKSNEPSDETHHEVYSPSPSHVTNNSTNVCKVKPTQQAATGNGTGNVVPTVGGVNAQHHIGSSPSTGVVPPTVAPSLIGGGPSAVTPNTGTGQQPTGGNHLGSGHPLSPPPVQVMGISQQPPQAYTGANQHINYQPNLAGNAPYGGMSAIPSPPTVQFNISPHPTQGSLYGAFQMDQSRSQFSQFPAPYGIGQTASTPYNAPQSMYLQTGPPHPPNAQPPPDVYQNLTSPYRMAATGPFGQSQQINNNPSTVLISSTSNSLMSASVKPSTQQIGAIGTKAGAIGQGYGAQSQQGGQVYLPYDPTLPPSYMRGPGGPVQSSVVPAQIQPSNSYYSANAGAQTGFYQQASNSALPSAPPLHQHQTSFGLQNNVFSNHSGSSGTLQNFGSQFLTAPLQMAAAAAAIAQQQYRTQQGNVSGLNTPGGPNAQQQQQNTRQQQLKSPGGQAQDMFTSVLNSVFQQQQQQQQQNNRQAQNNMNMAAVGGRSQQLNAQVPPGTSRYPAPIQRPVSIQQAPVAMPGSNNNNNNSQRGHRGGNPQSGAQSQNRSQTGGSRQQQYYGGGGQSGTVTPSQEKTEEIKLNNTNTSSNVVSNAVTNNIPSNTNTANLTNKVNSASSAQNSSNSSVNDTSKDVQSTKDESTSKAE